MRALYFAMIAGVHCLSFAACQVLYDTTVAETERDCEKLVSQTQVQECRQKVRADVAAYRRSQDQKARDESAQARPDKASKANKANPLCYVKKSTGEEVCPN